MIRVGRCTYDKNGKRTDPKFPGFTNILCLTKSSAYGELGPYVLKNDKGQLMENLWQFQKVYSQVPKSTQYYSRWDRTIIWDHPAELHVDDDGEILDAYWNWRKKGINNKYPVRYPTGFNYRGKNLIGSLYYDEEKKEYIGPLSYIEARKKIYFPLYCKLVKKEPLFKELQQRLKAGENLLIIEVDGPHEEDMEYYKNKYGVDDGFIQDNTIQVRKEYMKIMLEDDRYSFGHGYCLAMALLGKDEDWLAAWN